MLPVNSSIIAAKSNTFSGELFSNRDIYEYLRWLIMKIQIRAISSDTNLTLIEIGKVCCSAKKCSQVKSKWELCIRKAVYREHRSTKNHPPSRSTFLLHLKFDYKSWFWDRWRVARPISFKYDASSTLHHGNICDKKVRTWRVSMSKTLAATFTINGI